MNKTNILITKKITISGVVQGVGFRPYVYRMAKHFKLVGKVSNSSSGVDIIIKGLECNVVNFLKSLPDNLPPLANIMSISINSILSFVPFNNFSISKSNKDNKNRSIITPDISICGDCLDDITNHKNRRYRYPFTNCTNCGPRYSIIKNVPYDRKRTSMASFKMCSLCQTEYDNPNDRRFHAQPNACPTCGPSLSLINSEGVSINSKDYIIKVSELIKEGKIVAIKGIGGFHLVVDATNEKAVQLLRRRKFRKDKPFAIMSSSLEDIRSYAFTNKFEEAALESIQKPIVLLKKKETKSIAGAVSPNNYYLGVMLPYTPLHYLLMNSGSGFIALVMTSANLSGEPIINTNKNAIKYLTGITDYILLNNRDIITRNDDSVLKYYSGSARIIRRSRGFAPLPIDLLFNQPPVLACGGETKNTICLTRGKVAFISQHIGNIESKNGYNFFLDTIDKMQTILKVKPDIVACDYHPDYMSSRYVSDLHGVKTVKVQHHHAHIVACAVENKVTEPVIGLALDGSGYGDDNTIWGGEVLICDYSFYERVASFETIPMPGGFMAIKEPWRMAISYLYKVFGESLLDLNLPFTKSIKDYNIKALISMICNKINTPYTSSLGRFFDGIAAIVGIRNKVSFEGQAAMEFEAIVSSSIKEEYEFKIIYNEKMEISTLPIIKNVVEDVINGIKKEVIAAKFHNTIVSIFVEICLIIKKYYNIKYVALSGGVFQNAILTHRIKHGLEKNSFKVLTHRLVPANDGGISLGQAVVAPQLI